MGTGMRGGRGKSRAGDHGGRENVRIRINKFINWGRNSSGGCDAVEAEV